MNENLEGRVTRLESAVEHIQSDLSDIKVELRRLNDKIDGKIDGIKTELASMKMWALGLYIGLSASLLFVMAKGFKWL